MTLDPIILAVETLWANAREIWSSGGWAMTAIAVIALVMFGVGMALHFKLRAKGHSRVQESTWRRWIERPLERRGTIGDLMDVVADGQSLQAMALAFDELRTSELTPLDRDLRVMKTCVSAAPLVGLLGTVTGMLSTFAALATGGGGDQTMGMVAKGISEALITTETGLVIALPGLFFQYQLARRTEGYRAFLAHLETVCVQRAYRLESERQAAARIARARAAAAAHLRERVRAALQTA